MTSPATRTPINWQKRLDVAHAARTRETLHKPMAAREDDTYAPVSTWYANRAGAHRRYLGHGATMERNMIGDEGVLTA